jgi:hypothetical protein
LEERASGEDAGRERESARARVFFVGAALVVVFSHFILEIDASYI